MKMKFVDALVTVVMMVARSESNYDSPTLIADVQ